MDFNFLEQILYGCPQLQYKSTQTRYTRGTKPTSICRLTNNLKFDYNLPRSLGNAPAVLAFSAVNNIKM